jgi:hypothetical protein
MAHPELGEAPRVMGLLLQQATETRSAFVVFDDCRYLPHLPELPDALVEVPVFRPDQARVETTDLEELGSPVAPGRLQPPDVIVEGALEAPDPGQ